MAPALEEGSLLYSRAPSPRCPVPAQGPGLGAPCHISFTPFPHPVHCAYSLGRAPLNVVNTPIVQAPGSYTPESPLSIDHRNSVLICLFSKNSALPQQFCDFPRGHLLSLTLIAPLQEPYSCTLLCLFVSWSLLVLVPGVPFHLDAHPPSCCVRYMRSPLLHRPSLIMPSDSLHF